MISVARQKADVHLNEFNVRTWRDGGIRSGGCLDLVQHCTAAMHARKDLNAFIVESHARAFAQAERSDERIQRGHERPLEGIVLAVKDNFCTFDIQTTAGSKILEGFVPKYESTVTKKLLDAGAIFIGKTNMDEFGMGSSTENSAYGPTLNPRGLILGVDDFVPGGSSGGSAAAVAANLCLGSIATDTGGSIRQPASFCGVVGFKPTYGLCSRWGIIAYASSLDQAGVITKTVHDAAILMDIIAGHDPSDSTSLDVPLPNFEGTLNSVRPGFTIGFPRQFRDMKSKDVRIENDLSNLWIEFERAAAGIGANVREVDMPTIAYSLPTYYIIALSEASSNLSRYDGVRFGYRSDRANSLDELYECTRAEGFRPETKRRIIAGTFCLSAGYYDAYYLRAQRVRRKIVNEFTRVFAEVDFLCWPTAPTPAFSFGSYDRDPVAMYLEDIFTVPVNLAGLPAVSVPICTASNGMPMGFQIIGPRLGDAQVLSAAHLLTKRRLDHAD